MKRAPTFNEHEKIVLLCEDEECGGALHSWFSEAGIHVEVAANGGEAVRSLNSHAVATLIMDRFPEPWPGLDAVATLKRQHDGLRVVVVGDPLKENFGLARAVGVDVTLPRPLTRQAVLAAIGLGR
jgi:DNA-binding response OmpR family regulator